MMRTGRRRPALRKPRWGSLHAVVGLLAVLWVVPLGAQPEEGGGTEGVTASLEASPAQPKADAQLLDEVYRQHHISSQFPEPGFGQYLQDLGTTFGENLTRWLSVRIGGLAGSASQLLTYIGYTLLGVLAAICLWLGIRYLIQQLQQSAAPSQGDDTVRALGTEVAPAAAESWESALRQALADGDVGRAVHALWWWLAQSLGSGADPSWTSRELVQRSGRRDLRSYVRRLDRLLYSPRTPRLDDVESLWRDLQPLVGTPAGSAQEEGAS